MVATGGIPPADGAAAECSSLASISSKLVLLTGEWNRGLDDGGAVARGVLISIVLACGTSVCHHGGVRVEVEVCDGAVKVAGVGVVPCSAGGVVSGGVKGASCGNDVGVDVPAINCRKLVGIKLTPAIKSDGALVIETAAG